MSLDSSMRLHCQGFRSLWQGHVRLSYLGRQRRCQIEGPDTATRTMAQACAMTTKTIYSAI